MATAYSEEVAVGSYNRIRLRVEYSGTSASCYIEFRRTSDWTDTWGDDAAEITFNGTTQSAPYWYSGTVGTSWVEIASASGFTVPLSGGTFSWEFNNPMAQSVLGCSGTITIGSQATAPTGLGLSKLVSYVDGFSAKVYVSSWGGAGDSSSRYRELQVWTYDASSLVQPQRFQTAVGDSLSSTITTNNSSQGTLNIQPNTRYTIGIYASNGTLNTGSVRIGDYATLPPTPTSVSATGTQTYVTANTVSVPITVDYGADGGSYTKTFLYRSKATGEDWNEWATLGTVTSGSAGTLSSNIVLACGNTFDIEVRVSTSAGGSSSSIYTSVTTLSASSKLYGSVNGATKQITKLYGGVSSRTLDSVTGTIRTPSNGVITGFNATTFVANIPSATGYEADKTLSYVEVYLSGDTGRITAWLVYTDNTRNQFYSDIEPSVFYGISVNAFASDDPVTDYLDLTPVYITASLSKEIVKLYGSVNGQTKLIYKSSGT